MNDKIIKIKKIKNIDFHKIHEELNYKYKINIFPIKKI